MRVGYKRALIARIGVVLGFVCGLIGLLAGLTDHTWKLGSVGWFTGGALLTIIALCLLVESTIALQEARTTKA
jgi:hypothetical protein